MPLMQLSTGFLDKIQCPEGKAKVDYFDMSCRGLMVEIRPTGRKVFYFRYTDFRGVQRQIKLASTDDLSLDQARKKVAALRNQIALGQDPFALKTEAKQVPTFAQFIADQYMPFIMSYKRSWDTDASILKNHLLPRFGKRYMDEITRQDIVKIHGDRKASGAAAGSANRLLIMMRYIFNLALKWEVPGIKTNPCKGIPLMEENNKMERYLSVEEAQRLYEAVCKSENTMLKFIVPMLILTGARKREVLDARWEDFDLGRRAWRIPISKSGKARHVPLSDGALTLLATMPRKTDCEWAFANPETGKPYVSIYYAWNTARKSIGLSDVRMHDLRHSFASLLINSGRTLYEVQHILGHTQVKTTQRYAHLSQDTLLAAANSATTALGAAMMPPVMLAPVSALPAALRA
ncbi:site-specific integrase [Limnohabitans sp. Rim28]|uniref:site-specific integrase n=1 Tax=Limnohabitans sp. Rim28 TaxID=1100720 RepID=UPI00030BC43B|nr:integrase [Limnohabitans sp. Rim28]